MARGHKKKPNLLLITTQVLAAIGRPIFTILYLIGHAIVILASLRIEFPKIRIPKIHLPKVHLPLFRPPKIHLPKINFPKIHIPFKKYYLIFPVLLIFTVSSFYFFILKDLPSPYELGKKTPQVSTKIYDRNGKLLYKIFKDENRTVVPLSRIPIHVRLATLAAEDAEFYNHPGFSIKGISRALVQNFREGSLQGGSTITQQLVKNVLLSPERTFTRKIKELIVSVEAELTYTKDQILEMYLNQVSYGGTAYGIEEASASYFGKSVENLTLAEAAFLAGLPKSPTTFSPFGQNPELAFERQREVLHLMRINRFITKNQEEDAIKDSITFIPNKIEIRAPHFVMYVRQILVDMYGEEMVDKGGLEVVTSLDLSIQELAEKVVRDEVSKLRNLRVSNGAALVIDPKNGEILAMVGSKDYFATEEDGNVNVTLRLRQPGSSIKVVNYAYALSHDYTPASIIDDSPITYVTPGSPPYSPVNYDGQFVGRVSLRSALAQSRNIPAVKVLASYGVSKMIEQGQKLGITTWDDPSNFGLSLTLGGGAVKMIDLAKVYATIANSGVTTDISPIIQVKDYRGTLLNPNTNGSKSKVLDPRVTFQLTDILRDNLSRAPEFGLNSQLVIKNHPEVAVKTGTSNDLRDNWTFGYNQNYVVATWVGNNDNSEMSRVASGVTGASPIWNKIMSSLLQNQDSIDWEVPEGLVKINCGAKSEWFLKENVLSTYCKPIPSPSPNPITGPQIL